MMTNETSPYNKYGSGDGPEPMNNPTPAPEKKEFSTKKKIVSFMAGAALTLAVIGVGDRAVNALRHDSSTKTEASSANPNAEQQNLSAEAKAFVAEYGNRYSDPVSTYYADRAYKNEYGIELVMTDEHISGYDTTAQMGATSTLGFERYMIPKNAKIDQATSMKIFNEYTTKELSLYINYLAKNPTPEGIAIVDFEFTRFCSAAGNDNTPEFAFHQDDAGIATLMETAKSLVDEYGSAANYNVEPASNNSDSHNISYFNENDSTDAQAVDEKGKVTAFSSLTDLGISVESYNKQNFTQNEEIFKNFELEVVLRLKEGNNSVPISIGQIAIP